MQVKMRKLRVGHVGGRLGYARLFNSHPRTETVALCDLDPQALERSRSALGLSESQCFSNYDDFLKTDLDIVFIATPIPFHAEQSIKALESGKHVLSEVTAASSVEACRTLVRAVRKTGMKYMLAENMCYVHFVREWKEIIQGGGIGEIFYAEAEYIHQTRDLLRDVKTGELTWRALLAPLHYCSHSLGPLLMILGDRVVKATGSGKSMHIMPNAGVGAIDMQVALFETKKGLVIKLLRSSTVSREPPFHYYSIYGSKGCLENTGFRSGTNEGLIYVEGRDKIARRTDCALSDPKLSEETRIGGHGTCEYYIVKDFIETIDSDGNPPIDVVLGTDITLPGLIAHQAAMRGNVWLDVPHFE